MVEMLLLAWLIIIGVLVCKTTLSTIIKLGLYLSLAAIIISILY